MDDKTKDKFKAIWLSHSSIGDFLKCPRLYFLRNVYKDPRTAHKMTIMTPALALGQAVHEVTESLSLLPIEERFLVSPLKKFELAWQKVTGEKGGFKNHEQERQYKERGIGMLKNLEDNPGFVLRKAIKIKSENGLSYYWFSDEENIILCGKIDWLEYREEDDTVHIIDFKTGKNEEDGSSLQLPIYFLLASNTQKRKVKKASYWYLDRKEGLVENILPSIDDSFDQVRKVASRIKLARQINHFNCPSGGCRYCIPLERVLKSQAKLVGTSNYGQDIYVLRD